MSADADAQLVPANQTAPVTATSAPAHAEDSRTPSLDLGSGDSFDEAMGDCTLAYADRAERDLAALKSAVRRGEIVAYQEEG